MRVNEQIRAREVRLIGEDGTQLGILPLREALRIAAERGLDLVEVAPSAAPVVCRLMDFGRFKYEQAKKEKEARRHQRSQDLKEIKLRPRIDTHDLETKVRNARRFLEEGHKLRCTIMFRGREMAHTDRGLQVLDRVTQALEDVGKVEQEPRLEGRNMVMVFSPRTR